MVYRDIEKPLHLLRMQIHREHAIDACGVQQICDKLRCDRHARLIFAVLPRVPKKWNDSCNPVRACAPRRIHHDQ
jgi:hypothetical protein